MITPQSKVYIIRTFADTMEVTPNQQQQYPAVHWLRSKQRSLFPNMEHPLRSHCSNRVQTSGVVLLPEIITCDRLSHTPLLVENHGNQLPWEKMLRKYYRFYYNYTIFSNRCTIFSLIHLLSFSLLRTTELIFHT